MDTHLYTIVEHTGQWFRYPNQFTCFDEYLDPMNIIFHRNNATIKSGRLIGASAITNTVMQEASWEDATSVHGSFRRTDGGSAEDRYRGLVSRQTDGCHHSILRPCIQDDAGSPHQYASVVGCVSASISVMSPWESFITIINYFLGD